MKRSPLKRTTPLRSRSRLKRTPLKQTSKRQAKALREYRRLRAAYMADHSVCESCGTQPATDLHHKAGRGANLCRTETFMATCRQCHNAIHSNPSIARIKGHLI